MKLKLTNCRLAFANLFEAREQLNGGKKFDANFLLTEEDRKLVEAKLRDVAKEAFGARWETILKGLDKNRLCLRDGSKNINKAGEVYDGFDGKWYVVAKSAKRPIVLDGLKNPLTAADGKPYSGCYVDASVDLYAVSKKEAGGFGIFAELKGVQFRRDGDAFGGGAPASPDDFEEITDGALAEDIV